MIVHQDGHLSCSIYYGKKKWHQLIGSLIGPFLENKKNIYDLFFIQFSEDQGDHVRLTLLAGHSLKSLKTKLEREVSSYLIANPSENERSDVKEQPLFMNFRNNSVYWDLYVPDNIGIDLLGMAFVLNFRNELSKQIISNLQESEIDEESSLAFIIYAQLMIAKVFFPVPGEALLLLKELLNNMNRQISLNIQSHIDCQTGLIMSQNRSELLSLAHVVWHDLPLEKDFQWLEMIKKQCHKLKFDAKNQQSLFVQVSSLLFEHLNMQRNDALILSTSVIYAILVDLKVTKISVA